MGGSNELGILGYAECAFELDAQAKDLGIEDALGVGHGVLGRVVQLRPPAFLVVGCCITFKN